MAYWDINSTQDPTYRQPLIPWLHSSEPTEHTFAEARKIFAEFTLLQWLQIAAKLYRLIQSSFHNADSDATGNKSAMGYHHTYLKNHDIELVSLSTFPPDEAIQKAIDSAYSEVHSLWIELGFVYKVYMKPPSPTMPPINQLLQTSCYKDISEFQADGDDDSCDDSDSEFEADMDSSDNNPTSIPIFHPSLDCNASSQLEESLTKARVSNQTTRSILYTSVVLDMEHATHM